MIRTALIFGYAIGFCSGMAVGMNSFGWLAAALVVTALLMSGTHVERLASWLFDKRVK